CPQCAATMREVQAAAAAGYCVLLDQCPACGGIWCDRWELYPVTRAAAEQIDRVDIAALQRPVAAAGEALGACDQIQLATEDRSENLQSDERAPRAPAKGEQPTAPTCPERRRRTPSAGLECPRCRPRMFHFHDPGLPADSRIERCPNCDGMWLNRGELWRF